MPFRITAQCLQMTPLEPLELTSITVCLMVRYIHHSHKAGGIISITVLAEAFFNLFPQHIRSYF